MDNDTSEITRAGWHITYLTNGAEHAAPRCIYSSIFAFNEIYFSGDKSEIWLNICLLTCRFQSQYHITLVMEAGYIPF